MEKIVEKSVEKNVEKSIEKNVNKSVEKSVKGVSKKRLEIFKILPPTHFVCILSRLRTTPPQGFWTLVL